MATLARFLRLAPCDDEPFWADPDQPPPDSVAAETPPHRGLWFFSGVFLCSRPGLGNVFPPRLERASFFSLIFFTKYREKIRVLFLVSFLSRVFLWIVGSWTRRSIFYPPSPEIVESSSCRTDVYFPLFLRLHVDDEYEPSKA